MTKNSKTSHKAAAYSLQFQDLMDVIPTSMVAKHVDLINKKRSIEWVVDGYVVRSSMLDVYSVGYNDTEKFEFFLKLKDYKKFVEACEKRRAEIFEQIKVKKK